MKERPILFSSPMILALLDGRKTQTRRIVKPPAPFAPEDEGMDILWATNQLKCLYGKAGDVYDGKQRLWVRETWAIADNIHGDEVFYYKADNPIPKNVFDAEGFRWKPSIHMPRVVSRILLDVVDIRVERLQDISEEDAISEGIQQMSSGYWTGGLHKIKETPKHLPSPIEGFRDLWESINGTGSWDIDPWVFAISFKRVDNA